MSPSLWLSSAVLCGVVVVLSNPALTTAASQHQSKHDHHDTGHENGHETGKDTSRKDTRASQNAYGAHIVHETQISALPKTPQEIAEFVRTVRMGQDMDHNMAHSAAQPETTLRVKHVVEHGAMMELVPAKNSTHIAIGNGSWFDPDNWHNAEVPGDGARVVIPKQVKMQYDGQSDARLFTLRLDGSLEFATDRATKMVIDTFVVAPQAALSIGTAQNPVDADVSAEILISAAGPLDETWDPSLLSRGLLSHGNIRFHGARKDSHEKVVAAPMKGDKSLKFSHLPEGWAVGDEIIIAGTHYDSYKYDAKTKRKLYTPPEDERRIISKIEGARVFFDKPLIHDHNTPRDDLYTSVANLSRNIKISTEAPETTPITERGHVMFMQADVVDVRYVEFDQLGRTDKSKRARDAGEVENITSTTNVKGRYPVHLHRLGVVAGPDGRPPAPAIVTGSAVRGTPGWGFVHHDSHAILSNNASYDTFGAGFVSESGNETGVWMDNIAINARGRSIGDPKVQTSDLDDFDTGVSGDGFWFQSRMVASRHNIAASVNHGFVYFHRGFVADDAQLQFNALSFAHPEALFYRSRLKPDDAPILEFDRNETFAAKAGLHVVKSNPNQGHDIHSVLSNFTAWNVEVGAHLEYTSHYTLQNFDLIGRPTARFKKAIDGIVIGQNTTDITVHDAKITGFETGVSLMKKFVNLKVSPEQIDYIFVNPQISAARRPFENFDPKYDTILTQTELSETPLGLQLAGPARFARDMEHLKFRGTKTDSLGKIAYPSGTDHVVLRHKDVANILQTNGYYTTPEGQNFAAVQLYLSDRVSGDIYTKTALIELDNSITPGSPKGPYKTARFNGQTTFEQLQAMADQQPVLHKTAQKQPCNTPICEMVSSEH